MTDKLDLGINDADNYRKLSEPFPTAKAAKEAIEAFWKEFYELRNKYRLRDVHCIIFVGVKFEDGTEGDIIVPMHA